jgi:hypothetical protein
MAEFRKTIPASRINETTWVSNLAQFVVLAYLYSLQSWCLLEPWFCLLQHFQLISSDR